MDDIPINTQSGTSSGISYTICPNGPDPTAMPPLCIFEVDLGNAVLSVSGGPPTWNVTGTVPIRVADVPVTVEGIFNTNGTIDMGPVCPPSAQNFVAIPVTGTLTYSGSDTPVLGCSAVTGTTLTVSPNDVTNASTICGGNVPSAFYSAAASAFGQYAASVVQAAIDQAIQAQPCLQ